MFARFGRPKHCFVAGGAIFVAAAFRSDDKWAHAKGFESHSRRRLEDRIVTVVGTPVERGEQLGALFGDDIRKLVAHRQSMYSNTGKAVWGHMSTQLASSWRENATMTWKELEGMVRAGVKAEHLLLLGCDYEMQMASWLNADLMADSDSPVEQHDFNMSGRCTAFLVTEGSGSPICAQNVDEYAHGWLDGSRDVIIRAKSVDMEEPDALIYTHPGAPAYCGMNSAGLCVMNNVNLLTHAPFFGQHIF
jgi:hypothetical protein